MIIGDSWGVGEWPIHSKYESLKEPNGTFYRYYKMAHRGLAQYLEEAGHTVYNFSKGGDSMYRQIELAQLVLDRLNDTLRPEMLIVFYTDYLRDMTYEAQQICSTVAEIESQYMSEYHTQLSEIATTFNIPVILLGGASDIPWIDDFSEQYPGVSVACQSITNLLVNGNHRIDDPVFYVGPFHEHKMADKDKAGVTALLDKAITRHKLWEDRTDLFAPDGEHPNRNSHKILYDYLMSNNLL